MRPFCCFQNSFFVLFFNILTKMCLGMDLFVFILFCNYWSLSNLSYICVLYQIRKLSAIILSNTFSAPFSYFCLSGILITNILIHFSEVLFIFPLCFSCSVIFINLSSSSWILSFVSLNLLLSPLVISSFSYCIFEL